MHLTLHLVRPDPGEQRIRVVGHTRESKFAADETHKMTARLAVLLTRRLLTVLLLLLSLGAFVSRNLATKIG